MIKESSEFQKKSIELIIILGKMMRDFMLIEYSDTNPSKTRLEFSNEIQRHHNELAKTAPNLNHISLPNEHELQGFPKESLPAFFELGKLCYEYLNSKGDEGINYRDICNYVLQAFSSCEPKGEADLKSLQALFMPIQSMIDIYLLLGERGLKIVNIAERTLKPQKSPYQFLRTKESLTKEFSDLKSNYIKAEIKPLCILIDEAEMKVNIGLNREKFNSYLEKNMDTAHQRKAKESSASLLDYFDSSKLPQAEKHFLRDSFINENLSENQQNHYFNAKNLLALYKGEITFEKFKDLTPVSEGFEAKY